MLTTRYVPGAPNRLDLGTPDLDGATAFYGVLFDWTFRPAGPGTGAHGTFQLEGGGVAGGTTVAAGRGPSSWTVSYRSDDVDATASAAREHGGSVLLDPVDVPDEGRTAVLADPDGVGFGVWRPGAVEGLDLVGVPGALCWTELHSADPAAECRSDPTPS
ncbi:VOC family protein [Streptomyces sp. JNUCC 64]